MKILFLDDMHERIPKLRNGEEVEYVRNDSEFVGWLTRHGTPDCISFDHDLSDEHYAQQEDTPILPVQRQERIVLAGA
jgi:hypothetical protein